MVVGAAVVEIRVHGSQSLKQKRGVVRSISSRVRNRFNVSVAEVGGQGTWQQATLGISAAGAEVEPVRKVLVKAVAFIEELHLAEVVGSDIEIIRLPVEGEGLLGEGPWDEGFDSSDDEENDEENDEEDDEDLESDEA